MSYETSHTASNPVRAAYFQIVHFSVGQWFTKNLLVIFMWGYVDF